MMMAWMSSKIESAICFRKVRGGEVKTPREGVSMDGTGQIRGMSL